MQAGVPETLLDQLPADFVGRSMDLVANSRVAVAWHQHSAKTGFKTVVVTPLSPSVGQPLGLLMLGHSRNRHFTKAELFLLQSLAGEISWAVRELRSKRQHNRLLSAASLELKNALDIVLGECALLSEIDGLELTTEQRRKLTGIEKNTLETLRTINGFLDTTIAAEDRFVVSRENVNLVAVIEAALGSCRDKAREAGVELEGQYAADLPREYFTDPARFRHLLGNLAAFAIEISEQGRVLCSVRKNSDFVDFNLKVSKPRTEVSAEAEGGRPHAGGCAHGRLEMIRQDLKMLDGQWHFVRRSAEGLEIGIRLA